MNDKRPAPLEGHREEGCLFLRAHGDWVAERAGEIDEALGQFAASGDVDLEIDASGVREMDIAGAWLLHRTRCAFEASGSDARILGVESAGEDLLALVGDYEADGEVDAAAPTDERRTGVVERIGRGVDDSFSAVRRGVAFFGLFLATLVRVFTRPRSFPWTPLFHHMDDVTTSAVPVVSLIGFLIGVVIAYQGALQLGRFGAETLVVDLVAISVLREIGILLTAVVVAGRSGSAFTAEIGAMSLAEEIDAMRGLGFDPIERLVVPRVLALVAMLPALTLVGDLTALFGGGLVCWSFVDLPPAAYLGRLREAAGLENYLIGLGKAPVFGAAVAMAGCYQGFAVREGATDLGRRTTRSVVLSISLVLILDAFFSVLLANVGI